VKSEKKWNEMKWPTRVNVKCQYGRVSRYKIYSEQRSDDVHAMFIFVNIFLTNSLIFLPQDALMHNSNEKLGLRGFRKQLSGRFKRLVSRKSHEPAPVIPPELKPQLKTIYVY
jgi:hypothetical protein